MARLVRSSYRHSPRSLNACTTHYPRRTSKMEDGLANFLVNGTNRGVNGTIRGLNGTNRPGTVPYAHRVYVCAGGEGEGKRGRGGGGREGVCCTPNPNPYTILTPTLRLTYIPLPLTLPYLSTAPYPYTHVLQAGTTRLRQGGREAGRAGREGGRECACEQAGEGGSVCAPRGQARHRQGHDRVMLRSGDCVYIYRSRLLFYDFRISLNSAERCFSCQ